MTVVRVDQLTDRLAIDDDGIWRTTVASEVSYPASGHSACLAVEESSFWFNHRNDCIRALVASLPPAPGRPMLDVGGGNGYVSLGLARDGIDVILVEPGESGAANAKRRGVEHVICATTQTAGIRAGSVGAIGLFDVIEHIEDDHAFMSEMCALLTPGDRVYATVPAYQGLWSADDEKAGHYRRYSLDEITALIEQAGFEVDYASYFFRPLPAPVLFVRTVPHRLRALRGRSRSSDSHDTAGAEASVPDAVTTARSHAANTSAISRVIRRLLRSEVDNVAAHTTMRFGGSIVIAAHRR